MLEGRKKPDVGPFAWASVDAASPTRSPFQAWSLQSLPSATSNNASPLQSSESSLCGHGQPVARTLRARCRPNVPAASLPCLSATPCAPAGRVGLPLAKASLCWHALWSTGSRPLSVSPPRPRMLPFGRLRWLPPSQALPVSEVFRFPSVPPHPHPGCLKAAQLSFDLTGPDAQEAGPVPSAGGGAESGTFAPALFRMLGPRRK